MLKRIYNLTSFFHMAIIAMFLLSLNGCGYKGAPYHMEETLQNDENVEFIIKKSSEENNESTKSR